MSALPAWFSPACSDDWEDRLGGYRVSVDLSEVGPDTMTDAGVPVSALLAIDRCALLPGDPSPIGRTETGELAYPVDPTLAWARLPREQAGSLLKALLCTLETDQAGQDDQSEHKYPVLGADSRWDRMGRTWPGGGQALRQTVATLLRAALEPMLHDSSAHAAMRLAAARAALLGPLHDPTSPDGLPR